MEHWVQVLLFFCLALLIYFVRVTLPSYIQKKAENLAQKQDLRELTEIAERIRAQFDKVNVVHRVQFEAEFRAYQSIWLGAHNVFKEFIRLNSLQHLGSRTK